MNEKLVEEKKQKLEELRKLVNPYPHSFEPTHKATDVLKHKLKPDEELKERVTLAGRIVLLRRMGKASFFHIEDGTGRIQAFITKEKVGNSYDVFKLLSLGDIVGISGTVFATKTGETTIHVQELTVLCKAIQPMPEKHHGVKDTEIRYRKRYLDLMTNKDSRERFRARSKIISSMRAYLDGKGFLEVETPALQPIYGGAAAKPFVTKHNALDMKLYLRISDELYLKRLIVGGFERVYEICKDFRNEGIDTSHNPEFTMLEWYMAYGDYNTGMQMFEEIIGAACKAVHGKTWVTYDGQKIDFSAPWPREKMTELIKKHANINVLKEDVAGLRTFCDKNSIPYGKSDAWGVLVQHIFEETCEKHLIQPTFVIDHPIETTPLCKPLRDGDERFVERFEAFCAGMEICNAYTELNDPVLQRKLLDDQNELRMTGDDEAHPMDEDFLQAIEYGMPPTSGMGIGIDRIAMLLTDTQSIRDVILFPTLRPEE